MDRHNNGRTASPESGLERREQMQKSVKKSNKKTGAAGKYTAPGAFGGAQPSNLVELIEAQRGKAASSAGKKQAADTALANEWADLQLQSFGQFGADPAAIAGQQAGQTACALPGFVDSKNEEKTERNAGYLVVSQSGGGMLRQGTRKGIRRTPANRGMRAHRIVKGLDISEDVCHGMCP